MDPIDLQGTGSNIDAAKASAVSTPLGFGLCSLSSELIIAESRPPKMPIYLRAAISKNPNIVDRYDIINQIDAELLPENPTKLLPEIETGLIPESPGENQLSSRPHSFALCGFGGLGKTQTAALYALERTDEFDAIFWVQASDVGKLYKGFRDIAEALDLIDEGDQGDMVISRDKVLQWLGNPRKQQQPPPAASSADTTAAVSKFAKWLIIFDNADNIEIVSEFWPLTTHGSILVTSRDPLAKTDLATKGIDLPPMTSSECVRLLGNHMGEEISFGTVPAASNLCENLGYIPLAISQVATQIRRDHTTVEEYLDRHGKGSLLGELNKVKALPPREKYRFTVSTAWKVEAFSPQALCLLCVMAFMDPGAVAESILQQNMAMASLPLADEVRYLYPGPKDLYVDARAELLRTSLVSRNAEAGTLGWNRLVQEVVREKMTPKERHIYYQAAIDLLYQAWKFARAKVHQEGFPQKECDQVLPHVFTILSAYDSVVPQSGLPLDTARNLVTLLDGTGCYLGRGLRYMPASTVFDGVINICRNHGDEMEDFLTDEFLSCARVFRGMASTGSPCSDPAYGSLL